ncbi:hypothetical protein HY572_04465 [Candidatus Micrarchaeota archaeon]|nr:hypothetical protein [Candidatus Micrarchaeota archaeon]
MTFLEAFRNHARKLMRWAGEQTWTPAVLGIKTRLSAHEERALHEEIQTRVQTMLGDGYAPAVEREHENALRRTNPKLLEFEEKTRALEAELQEKVDADIENRLQHQFRDLGPNFMFRGFLARLSAFMERQRRISGRKDPLVLLGGNFIRVGNREWRLPSDVHPDEMKRLLEQQLHVAQGHLKAAEQGDTAQNKLSHAIRAEPNWSPEVKGAALDEYKQELRRVQGDVNEFLVREYMLSHFPAQMTNDILSKATATPRQMLHGIEELKLLRRKDKHTAMRRFAEKPAPFLWKERAKAAAIGAVIMLGALKTPGFIADQIEQSFAKPTPAAVATGAEAPTPLFTHTTGGKPPQITLTPGPAPAKTPAPPTNAFQAAAQKAVAAELGVPLAQVHEHHPNAGYDFIKVTELLLRRKAQVDPHFTQDRLDGFAQHVAKAVVNNTGNLILEDKDWWIDSLGNRVRKPPKGPGAKADTWHNLNKLLYSLGISGQSERERLQSQYKDLAGAKAASLPVPKLPQSREQAYEFLATELTRRSGVNLTAQELQENAVQLKLGKGWRRHWRNLRTDKDDPRTVLEHMARELDHGKDAALTLLLPKALHHEAA